jgi:hypothetical protein
MSGGKLMKTTKRIISALLSACFILSFTLIFSFAADHTMTAPLDLSAASADEGVLETDGYHWDNANSTLTIKDLTITLDNVTADGTAAITLPGRDCKVIIEGTNKIAMTDKATASGSRYYGFHCVNNISVSGSGILDFAYTGNTDSNNENRFYGIYSEKELSLNGVTLSATASGYRRYSNIAEADGALTITDSKLTASGTAICESNDSSITVTGSTLIGDATDIDSDGASIYSYGDMLIKNSTINAKCSGWAGIVCESGTLTIDSSDVTAVTDVQKSDVNEGSGIEGYLADIVIKDSTVNATGTNYGIISFSYYNKSESKFTGGNISITGSEVTAKSTTSGFPGIASMFVKSNSGIYEDITAITANIMPITITDETVVQGNAINTNKTYLSRGDLNPTYTGTDKDIKGVMIVTFSPDTTKAASASYNAKSRIYLVSNASQTVVLTKDISSKVVLNGGTLNAGTVLKAGDDILTALGTPAKANNTFAGWFYDAACTKPVKAGDKYARGMVLYAKWTANTSANTVNTGDSTAIGAAVAMTLASIAGTAFVSKKKAE